MIDLENFPTSSSAQRMIESVDSGGFYDNAYVGKWIFQVMGLEMDEARQFIEELPYQAFPETATWGLRYHEQKYVLPVRENLSYEERRRYIYQKRDERYPMNPFRMEITLENMTGRKAHVDDESGPVNTFTVKIESGDNPVNVAEAIKKLKKVKQSHVAFTLSFTALANIEICASAKVFRTQHTQCGTVPMVSTGLRLLDSGIEIAPELAAYKEVPPLSGNSGEAGQYPKTSIGLKVTDGVVEAEVFAAGHHVSYPETGEELKTGTHPGTQSQAVYTEMLIEAEVDAEGHKFQNKVSGTAPVVSNRLSLNEVDTRITADGKGMKIPYAVAGENQAGTIPKTSSGVQESGEAVVPEVTTEYYQTRYKLCGDAFEI